MNFKDLNLDSMLQSNIEACTYVTMTEVQERVFEAAQDGSDLYVQSQTGTGKTAAYLIPVIQALLSKPENAGKKLLVLVPTRELAVQVEEEAKALIEGTNLKTFSFYGGVGYEKQIAAIKAGCDIMVATPGRAIDLIEGKNLTLKDAYFTVIDEADRMFDMGFYPDLRTILKELPEAEERQTMLFSATLNTYVKNLAWEYTRDPKEITIEAENITVSEIAQELIHVSSDEKMKLLVGVLKRENPASVMIFCNTKRSCEVIAKRLQLNDLKADFLIGDLPQSKRLQVLNKFREGQTPILVATDVAARGIDVDDMAMVINYDLPVEAENYVHRIGRTARAGKTGKAYTFCSEQDVYNLPAIERYVEMSIPSKVAFPEDFEEDKSAGVYIRTDNYGHDDFEHGRDNRRGGRDNRNGNRGGRDNRGPRRDGGNRQGGEKRDGYKGNRNNYKGKNGGYNKKPYNKPTAEEMEKMQNMPLEERMKLYKEKYNSGNGQGGNRNNNGKRYDNRNQNRNYNKNGKGGNNRNYNNYGKNQNNYKGKKPYNKPAQKPAPQKKGLFAKIKAFFTGK
ncbi:MAG: DEAD/DEAH box helicase [Treponema sp.]|nr:DEAD/DEAH box helicase [Treponema sp.]